jgi:hypothetical protein
VYNFILIFILINIRSRQGKDWKSIARELGYREIGGLFAVDDDGNPAWEDVEYEEENAAQFEDMWREEEKMNGETLKEMTDDVGKKGQELQKSYVQVC